MNKEQFESNLKNEFEKIFPITLHTIGSRSRDKSYIEFVEEKLFEASKFHIDNHKSMEGLTKEIVLKFQEKEDVFEGGRKIGYNYGFVQAVKAKECELKEEGE